MTGLTCELAGVYNAGTNFTGEPETAKRFTLTGSCSLRGRIFTFDPDKERQEENNWEMQELFAAHVKHITLLFRRLY